MLRADYPYSATGGDGALKLTAIAMNRTEILRRGNELLRAMVITMSRVPAPAVILSAMVTVLAGTAVHADAQTAAGPPGEPTCIAIVLPSVKGVSGDATEFAAAVRERFVDFLTGPSLRAVAVEARLSSQAIEEARQKHCDRVLLTSIALKRHDGSGWARTLGGAAGSAAWYGVPYGTAATAAARGAAIAGAQVISTMAASTKAKDEVTLEYRFGSVDTVARAAPRVEKAKAKRDGEDLLTPLVEKASEVVAAASATK